VVVFLK